LDGARKRSWHI